MSQTYRDIPNSSQSDSEEDSISDTSEFKEIKPLSRKKTRVNPNNEKTKKSNQAKGSSTTTTPKEPKTTKKTTSKKGKTTTTTKEGSPPTKMRRTKATKTIDMSSLTSKSKIKAVPKALESKFRKLPKSCWKKVVLPKERRPPILSKTQHKSPKKSKIVPSLPKHKSKKQIIQAISKPNNNPKQYRIDALLAAVSDMCKLVIKNGN